MKAFWDKRYEEQEYAYGEKPNQFFKQELLKLDPKRILLAAEGEGRNAVFAAKNGWEVNAFDFSASGRKKALALAKKHGVKIHYELADFNTYDSVELLFDCIALIYVHTPPTQRSLVHKKMIDLLNPGGTLILEGFSKAQIKRDSGGPKNVDMLFSAEEIRADFHSLEIVKLEAVDTELSEGEFHQGKASVVRFLAKKKL